MKILGLDISSSNTGWSIVEVDNSNNKLVDYGIISPVGNMGVTQRLYFFGNELKKVVDKCSPDEIAIEETILVHGPKTMRVLARFSGVALFLAYSFQKREISTYEPPAWKKNLGLRGNAKKAEVQLAICKEFGLIEQKKIDEYQSILTKIVEDENQIRKTLSKDSKSSSKETVNLEKTYKEAKKKIKAKKKKEITEEDTKNFENLEIQLNQQKEEEKIKIKQAKEALKDIDKRYEKVSIDIYSDCGISPDIADSIGVSLCALSKLK